MKAIIVIFFEVRIIIWLMGVRAMWCGMGALWPVSLPFLPAQPAASCWSNLFLAAVQHPTNSHLYPDTRSVSWKLSKPFCEKLAEQSTIELFAWPRINWVKARAMLRQTDNILVESRSFLHQYDDSDALARCGCNCHECKSRALCNWIPLHLDGWRSM